MSGTDSWRAIAKGLSSAAAALEAGVPQVIGTRWFRKAGGMPPAKFRFSSQSLSGRYLSLLEREEIALLWAQGRSMQEIGRRLGRAASTISRELRRNAATRSGGLEYRATTAQWHADRSARRPKPTKLALNKSLRTYVEEGLAGVVVAQDGALFLVRHAVERPPASPKKRSTMGQSTGARSRLPDVWRSTSRTIRRCASVTKPSIRPYSFRGAEHCAAS